MKTVVFGLALLASIALLRGVPQGAERLADREGLDAAAFECLGEQGCRLVSDLLAARGGPAASAVITTVSVSNGGHPFRGDRSLLATISPNGDGFRERATIRFRLTGEATVRLVIARTERRARAVYDTTRRLRPGRNAFVWAPPSTVPSRTYVTYLEVRDRRGRTTYGARSGDPRRRQTTPVIRVLGVDAAFPRDSYRPGETARLWVAADARRLTLQVLRCGAETLAASATRTVAWSRRRSAPQLLPLELGPLTTGVYYARLETGDGRVGFAPFVVRPRRLGRNRVAVVMPTYTWQAYNFRDADGDGWGETWYVHQSRRTVRLGRPHLTRGMPLAFDIYDRPFLRWLAATGREVDYLAQRDLELASARTLHAAYDLVVFPGHHEYVTRREYDVVATYRNLGGNLMFLSANNFFWRVDRNGTRLRRLARWRTLGRPEAALIGVQYVANGRRFAPYRVRDVDAVPSLFGLSPRGSLVGRFGIEVDMTAHSSPAGTRVLADIPNLFGPGLGAQMTYYETSAGARVFAAGAFTVAGRAMTYWGRGLLERLWAHMTESPWGLAAAASPDRRGRLEAAFARESYQPGGRATLQLWNARESVLIQVFRVGPERERTRRNDELKGEPVSDVRPYPGRRRLAIPLGDWPTGVYFARVAAGGRVAFAPLVLRPRRLGRNRVAVVMPTNTWQAYNFRDDDGDGAADTWYADRSRIQARMARPFLHRGVPLRFRSYDLPFLHWLAWGNRAVDYLAQADLERLSSARRLRHAYDLIVFPGHHEYVTGREFDLVTRYRDLGGNLAFLSANNFFWKVERRGDVLHKVAMWRDLGRPEAALVGVQYVAYGSHLRGAYVLRGAPPWLLRGTGLRNGSSFGTFGIEVDRLHPASPRGTRVVAELRNGQPAPSRAQMSYYELRGARVFAAGAFTLAGCATRSYGAKLLDNLWEQLTRG